MFHSIQFESRTVVEIRILLVYFSVITTARDSSTKFVSSCTDSTSLRSASSQDSASGRASSAS